MDKSRLLFDATAWISNVGTSCAIIFVNKILMNRSGYGFIYGTGNISYPLVHRKIATVRPKPSL
jgi:hypothetical protein